jgi:hypothetical protein
VARALLRAARGTSGASILLILKAGTQPTPSFAAGGRVVGTSRLRIARCSGRSMNSANALFGTPSPTKQIPNCLRSSGV